jgi:hypothetical protein
VYLEAIRFAGGVIVMSDAGGMLSRADGEMIGDQRRGIGALLRKSDGKSRRHD